MSRSSVRSTTQDTTLHRILILPDAHTPFHDACALEGLILDRVVPAFRWSHVVVLGDWFDNYGVSKYTKNPQRLRGMETELAVGRSLLQRLRDLTPEAHHVFLEGNHERRWEKAVSEKMPEIYEVVMGPWRDLFQGWTYIPYMQSTCIGKLHLTHDVGRAGIHSTHASMRDYRDNLVIGHNHVLDYRVEGDAQGVSYLGASFGWLGDWRQIDYRHQARCRREWALGFGVGYHDPQTSYVYVQPVPVVEYTCVIEGRLFHASTAQKKEVHHARRSHHQDSRPARATRGRRPGPRRDQGDRD